MMETEEVSITASILRFSADDEGLGHQSASVRPSEQFTVFPPPSLRLSGVPLSTHRNGILNATFLPLRLETLALPFVFFVVCPIAIPESIIIRTPRPMF
ncbi:hypothetical protein AFLA_001911 [Aspergillus flavus NRRL3357]|nr:hypothetical protein AFLA_001911 [Aspergillus flavus NRRL3357]